MGLRYYIAKRGINSNQLSSKCLRTGSKRGQTLAEYALILAFISVVAIGTLIAMGAQASGAYSTINKQLKAADNGGVSAPAHNH